MKGNVKMQNDISKIYLQVERPEEEEDTIDLVEVVSNMGKKKKLYGYMLLLAVFAGILVGLVVTGVKYLFGDTAYARAMVSFQYEGIEDGLDPNGASFDINKIKSPVVIQNALDALGYTDVSAEEIREKISVEGVIPKDAVERITVINQMAEEKAENYEKILDVTYFPSQYIIYLKKDFGMSGREVTAILDAVLASYKEWFLDTYANTEVLTMAGNLLDYENYDYIEASDIIQSQIDIMINYVNERKQAAPEFRSAQTGLSFGDIQSSLNTVRSIDLAKYLSFVENKNLTKEKDRLREYYNYNIREYNMTISRLQTQLTNVQNTIDNYAKDPVVIVSSQDSTQEITQKNEYYDQLLTRKLSLTDQIANTNTKLNKTYTLLNQLNDSVSSGAQNDYDMADSMLADITSKLMDWTTKIEETTDEYYSTTQFSNAYKIAVPAKYQSAGGLMSVAKTIIICIGAMCLVVVFLWGFDGLKGELRKGRS